MCNKTENIGIPYIEYSVGGMFYMRRLFIFIFSFFIALSGVKFDVHALDKPNVSAKAVVLISADTGEIIYSLNAGTKLPMASTTKIMTTLLCIESGNLYEEFVVDSDAIKVEGSSMGLVEGDIVTKYALCCGMLLPSGNDAANATAVKLGGSLENFAKMMNERAKEIGMSNSYFVTPSGLEGTGHGASAYDMALLAREALKNEIFRDICSQETIQVKFGNPPYERWLKNTNKLLSMYDGVYGVKTGFTDEAGRCLVSACERDGMELICVTLNDSDDWNDHMSLYDYGFSQVSNYEYEIDDISANLVGGYEDKIHLYCESNPIICTSEFNDEFLKYEVKTSPFIYAPVMDGEQCGEITIFFKGKEVETLPLYADKSYEIYEKVEEKESGFGKIISKIKKIFK